jgi:glucokinase
LSLWEIPLNAAKPTRGEEAPGRLVFEKKYLNQDHESFTKVMRTFISEAKAKDAQAEPEVACLACAGPIVNNCVQFTNIAKGWTIDGAVLSQGLGIPQVRLLNDFEAMGYGLLTLNDSECLKLHDVAPTPGGVIGTCGAGTGLGECFLTKDPNSRNYVCWPTEGGHCDWSPRTDLEVELHQFLRKKYAHKHRVSQERVISGKGISDIYEFLSHKHPEKIDKVIHEEWLKAGSMQGAIVGKNADTNPLCEEAFRIFFEAFAKECGDACLKWLVRNFRKSADFKIAFGGFFHHWWHCIQECKVDHRKDQVCGHSL